jgi:hypothetical protein
MLEWKDADVGKPFRAGASISEKDNAGRIGRYLFTVETVSDRKMFKELDLREKPGLWNMAILVDDAVTVTVIPLDEATPPIPPTTLPRCNGSALWNDAAFHVLSYSFQGGKNYRINFDYSNTCHMPHLDIMEDYDGIIAYLYPSTLDLDTDLNGDGKINADDEALEETPGRILSPGAIVSSLQVKASGFKNRQLRLRWTSPGLVKVQENGNDVSPGLILTPETNDKVYDFTVKALSFSVNPGDIAFTLEAVEDIDVCDKINFTVLGLDLDADTDNDGVFEGNLIEDAKEEAPGAFLAKDGTLNPLRVNAKGCKGKTVRLTWLHPEMVEVTRAGAVVSSGLELTPELADKTYNFTVKGFDTSTMARDIVFTLEVVDAPSIKDTVTVTVVDVDLDANTDGDTFDKNDAEDALEESPGLFIKKDTSEQMQIHVKGCMGTKVKLSWTNDTKVEVTGATNGQILTPDMADKTYDLTVKELDTSTTAGDIAFTLEVVDAPSIKDTVKVMVVDVDLDANTDGDTFDKNDVEDALEDSPGLWVLKNTSDSMQIHVKGCMGTKVKLSWTNNTKVEVTGATNGQILTPDMADKTYDLTVKGLDTSTTAGDIAFTLEVVDAPSIKDTVKVTVFEVAPALSSTKPLNSKDSGSNTANWGNLGATSRVFKVIPEDLTYKGLTWFVSLPVTVGSEWTPSVTGKPYQGYGTNPIAEFKCTAKNAQKLYDDQYPDDYSIFGKQENKISLYLHGKKIGNYSYWLYFDSNGERKNLDGSKEKTWFFYWRQSVTTLSRFKWGGDIAGLYLYHPITGSEELFVGLEATSTRKSIFDTTAKTYTEDSYSPNLFLGGGVNAVAKSCIHEMWHQQLYTEIRRGTIYEQGPKGMFIPRCLVDSDGDDLPDEREMEIGTDLTDRDTCNLSKYVRAGLSYSSYANHADNELFCRWKEWNAEANPEYDWSVGGMRFPNPLGITPSGL